MSELYRDDYYSVRVEQGILRLVRSATPYASMDALNEGYRGLAAAIRAAGVRRVLLDLRGGPPGRNDADFEQTTAVWRKQLAETSDRVAILVRTAAGRLQSQRLARDEGRPANVFMDEAEALAYLRT